MRSRANSLFSWILFYSIELLGLALGVEDGLGDAKLKHDISYRLGISGSAVKSTKTYIRPYVFFDARKQLFDYQFGITNTNLCKLMGENLSTPTDFHEATRAQIANCFSMLNIDASPSTQHDLIQRYRGHFTPQFYPQRFALKDAIYWQFLPTLQLLLEHVLTQYQKSSVTYVEFSMGMNDLLSPWVYRHLTTTMRPLHDPLLKEVLAEVKNEYKDPTLDEKETLEVKENA